MKRTCVQVVGIVVRALRERKMRPDQVADEQRSDCRKYDLLFLHHEQFESYCRYANMISIFCPNIYNVCHIVLYLV
jgi:hypothetical protein